ncbi:MAG: galactokinase [Gemmatimonadota bacterium]|nr:galactokinase [Gemmatimonadota bacterium]
MDPQLIAEFRRRFRAAPSHVVRAPGRVNLIGGHIDYHGLPVLPVALDRDVRLLFRPRTDGVVRAQTCAAGLAGASFELATRIPSAELGDWSNYVRGAAQSMVLERGVDRGLDLLVNSTLPMAVGLSSSSALAVAASLALARVNDLELDRVEFAGQMAVAERYVGTQGGGMDQAVCLLALAGHAVYVEFLPLTVRPIALPSDLRVVVAHSLERVEKSGVARAAYNDRRRNGELALALVASHLGLAPNTSYGELINQGDIARQAAAQVLSGSAAGCFRHVVSEARRVAEAVAALESGDLVTLGGLMDASHESLRENLEVSTPALDELVAVARRAGALGCRLTGAGFGGSAVALVAADRVDDVYAALAKEYYQPRGVADPVSAGSLFTCRASGAATVETLG